MQKTIQEKGTIMTKKRVLEGVTYCNCLCHCIGFDLNHFMPCCDLVYKKYINFNLDEDSRQINMKRVRKYVKEYKIQLEESEKRQKIPDLSPYPRTPLFGGKHA